jgi:hypothetical protein
LLTAIKGNSKRIRERDGALICLGMVIVIKDSLLKTKWMGGASIGLIVWSRVLSFMLENSKRTHFMV